MTCGRCLVFFCWVCKKQILDNDPYKHFGNRGAVTRNRLTILVEMINALNPTRDTLKIGIGCNLHTGGHGENLDVEQLLIIFIAIVLSPICVLIGLSYSMWYGYKN
jgi:hypothetical protein